MLASPAASQDSRGKVIVSDGMTVTELARSLQTSPRELATPLPASLSVPHPVFPVSLRRSCHEDSESFWRESAGQQLRSPPLHMCWQ